MNPTRDPKEHRLFHYTRQRDHLEDILRNGFWPRFCEEDFEWLVERTTVIAIPMVCFCDIPLDAAGSHRGKYGNYALGFSKSWVEKLDINPVWYVHTASQVRGTVAGCLFGSAANANQQVLQSSNCGLLAFLKPTIGAQKDRSASSQPTTEVLAFDDEMEWRHTPLPLRGHWIENSSSGFVTSNDHELSKAHRLQLPMNAIETVRVQDLADVGYLTGIFPQLLGKIETW